MKSRAARLALLVLFMVALGVTAFLFRTSGSTARTQSEAASNFSDAVRSAARGVMEIRAAQRSYVAAGQDGDVWTGKVTEQVTAVRDTLMALRASASAPQAQTEIDTAVATLQDFVQMDGRARDYVHSNQKLLASDLIFSNGLELTDSVVAALDRAKAAELQARSADAATFERRQMFALAAAAAAAVLVVLLLFPRVDVGLAVPLLHGRSSSSHLPVSIVSTANFASSDDGWTAAKRTAESKPTAATAPPSTDAAPKSEGESPAASAPGVEAPPRGGPAPVPSAPVPLPIDLRGIAALCTQLSRVEDTLALPPLLERAATLLDAAGIILWISDPDSRELSPILAQGYPQQLIARLGSIPRDAQNATAAAFRTSLLQTVNGDDVSNGAIAAPLVTSGGCVGVMAAEVRGAGEKQEAKLAAAMIVAAQLASLVGPPASRERAVEAANA